MCVEFPNIKTSTGLEAAMVTQGGQSRTGDNHGHVDHRRVVGCLTKS